MATSYKNIVITPNTGSNSEPKIVFSGANTTANTDIAIYTYPTVNGTLSIEGSAGQLFSVTNSLSGTIFSVNDVSGIPSIEILDTGTIKLAQYSGNVGIGLSTANAKFHVSGSAIITGSLDLGTPLPLLDGGTGVTSAPAAFAQLMGYTTTVTGSNAGVTTLTNTSSQYQIFTGSTTQNITLPVTSTLTTGWTFHIVNNSTTNLTVYSSGANIVDTVYVGCTMMITCIGTTLTTAADWEYGYTDFGTGVTGINSVVRSGSPSISTPSISGGSLTGTTTLAATSYITNATSGNGAIPGEQIFRRTTNGAAIGPTIADVFTTPSSVALEASSTYELEGQLFFTKTTAGTALWTNLFSSAPTLFTMESIQSAVGGFAAATGATYTPLLLYFYAQAATTVASAATASLTTGVNHSFKFKGTIITNVACNWRLQLTQSAGTATPLVGSYYRIKKIGASTGTFAA